MGLLAAFFLFLLVGCVSTQGVTSAQRTPVLTPDHPYVAVFVDEDTEKRHGAFPLDRALYAKVLDVAARSGAKAVVVKYFLDQAKSGPEDDALARAMKLVPTLLQARMDPEETKPHPLDSRFALSDSDSLRKAPQGTSGWIPLPRFQAAAQNVGFVDLFGDPGSTDTVRIPLVERYKNTPFPSLTYAALSIGLGEGLLLDGGKALRFGKQFLPLTTSSELELNLQALPEVRIFSLSTVVSKSADLTSFKDKIIILGYEGPKMSPMETLAGPLSPHRFFARTLAAIHIALANGTTSHSNGPR